MKKRKKEDEEREGYVCLWKRPTQLKDIADVIIAIFACLWWLVSSSNMTTPSRDAPLARLTLLAAGKYLKSQRRRARQHKVQRENDTAATASGSIATSVVQSKYMNFKMLTRSKIAWDVDYMRCLQWGKMLPVRCVTFPYISNPCTTNWMISK